MVSCEWGESDGAIRFPAQAVSELQTEIFLAILCINIRYTESKTQIYQIRTKNLFLRIFLPTHDGTVLVVSRISISRVAQPVYLMYHSDLHARRKDL